MKNEISELEKKYWHGMADHDYETVKNLTKFPCIVAGKQGVMSVGEPAYKEMFEQGRERKIKVKGLSDEQIEVGNDHALIAYLIELEYNGKSMKCACTSTWLKEGGQWLCAMHTESELEVKEK
jgi:ketosteroid isomerase-like protein